jgi:membrane-associated phospholipid phosphatase
MATSAIPRLLQELAKQVFDAPRPSADLVQLRELTDSAAYPSGHVISTTVVFVLLALLVPLLSGSRHVVWCTRGFSGLMIAAVPVARVWLGVLPTSVV